MNAFVRVLAVAVKGDDGLHEGVVGVFGLEQRQAGAIDLGLGGDDDGGGLGGFELLDVLGVGEK
jgi:hypothetical protein